MADLTILGLTELHRALQDLPAKIERNVLRGGLRAGAKIIADQAKSLAPVKSGALRNSIRVSMRSSSRTGMVRARIRAGDKVAYYAHMVEYGTAQHWIRATERPMRNTRRGARMISINTLNKMAKRGSLVIGGVFVGDEVVHPGAQRRPFLRPAFDAKAQASIEEMARYIRERLPKEIAKQGRMP
jgi:HK97 gp10 family phage protein